MKPTYIGFNTQPYAVVVWDGRFKTFCYTQAELSAALARYNTPGDLYYQLPHNVHYFNKQLATA